MLGQLGGGVKYETAFPLIASLNNGRDFLSFAFDLVLLWLVRRGSDTSLLSTHDNVFYQSREK